MKRVKSIGQITAALMFLSIFQLYAQEEAPRIVTIARAHWDMTNENFSMEEWKKVESEYHEKVTLKNEYIVASVVLLHYYTPDNSEILFASVYSNWDNVEKAVGRNRELAREAWPNDEERQAFFDKQSSYYSNMHSDEIYSSMTLAKYLSEKPTERMIYYFRTSHTNWPEDGDIEEIRALRKEYVENVIHKNEKIQAYYPMRHLYGADSRERTEIFVMKSMADLEEMNDTRMEDLVNAHWPDEEKRKEFFKALNRYRSPWHGDLIYSSVPELMK
jgi:hypothetical protein